MRLIPRDTKFFDLFADMARNLGDGARLLKQTLDDFKDVEVRVQQLKDIEHRGDEMTHNGRAERLANGDLPPPAQPAEEQNVTLAHAMSSTKLTAASSV